AYTLENLNKVAAAAEKELTAPERIALVEDTWAMTRAGRYPVVGFMNLAQALRAEQDRHVIDLLAAHFEYLGSSLVSEGQESSYNKFIREQFAPLAAQLGWVPRSNDTEDQKTLRASLLQVMGEAGEPGAISAAQGVVKQYLEHPGSVEANMTGPAFTIASQTGDAALYKKLYSAFETARTPDEYYHYLFALAGFRQPELVERTLGLVAQGKVRQQDYPTLFGNLLANPAARPATWKYLKSHWDALAEKVTTFGGRGAVSGLGNFCSIKEADDIKRFFSEHRAPGAEGALKQSLERVENCVEFQQLQQANMEKWLQEQR
ncbi:MAG: ERAP1-like C-terminal domain-containing protein, partial [Candidatus Angelobacter sp.]